MDPQHCLKLHKDTKKAMWVMESELCEVMGILIKNNFSVYIPQNMHWQKESGNLRT
jgi:hypothetical protein